MLKILFWLLLAANIVLFVFQKTYFAAPSAGKREPERMAYQYEEDKIRIVSEDNINLERTQSKITAKQEAVQEKTAVGVCMMPRPFARTEIAKFEKQLASLSLTKGDITKEPVQEIQAQAYMVYITPAASQKAAEASIAALEQKGIKSHYVVKEPGDLKWAVSLGVFKTREAAEKYAAELAKSEITGIRVAPRGKTADKILYRINHLNDEQLRALQGIIKNIPGQVLETCRQDAPAEPEKPEQPQQSEVPAEPEKPTQPQQPSRPEAPA